MLLIRNAVLLIISTWTISITSAFVSVIAPGKIRLGIDQKIFLLGMGLGENERDMLVTIWPKGARSHTFYRQSHPIRNGEMTVININISPSDIVPPTTEHVTLSVRGGGFDKQRDIVVYRDPGYLFIQLDKPMYTSRQKVKYRVVAIGEDMRWAPWPVQISLMNPRGHLIDRVTKTAQEAFKGSELPLSRNPMKGYWKIVATYTNFTTSSIASFEVRDYVLPRFSVKVKTNASSVYMSASAPVKVNVEAQYVYGQPMHGRISITVLARTDWDSHVIIDRQSHELDNAGKAELIFNDVELMDNVLMEDPPVNIYMAINTTEEGTGVVLKKEIRIATFSDSPFTVDMVNRKNYFTPGLPYTLELKAVKADGKVAKNVAVDLVTFDQEPVTLTTDGNGRISREIPTTNTMTDLPIMYGPEGLPDHYKPNTIYAALYEVDRYLKVSTDTTPTTSQDLEVTVRFTSQLGKYFMMVSSRGKIVLSESFTSGSSGVDVRTIPTSILREMVPTARIIVFAVTEGHVIADSVMVELPNQCREELTISPITNQGGLKPKERGEIVINGGPGMTVGLLAVDKGVNALKYERSLTRKVIFDSLAAHDLGEAYVFGTNVMDLFESTGFTLMYSNDHLLATVGIHHTAKGIQAADIPGADDPLLRSFFPESWLFQEETLNSDGVSRIEVTYPDSVTTWNMYAVGVSRDAGICVSPMKKVTVTKKFFIDIDIPFKAIKLEEVRAKVTVSNYLSYDTGIDLEVTADGLCMPDAQGETMNFERFTVPNGGKVTKIVTLLPVSPGSFLIRARAMIESRLESDGVERKLFVTSEGEPTTKSISFSLNPQGEPRRDLTVRQSVNHNIQTTTVDMAFPEEAIPESEKIKITASGDILGDVIGQFVLGSDLPSDFEGVEGLMKEIAPSCYGLQYLNRLDALSPDVLHKGREHIRHGLSELMKYRNKSEGAFLLEEYDPDFESEPSTWFTAFVLKTLCAAKPVLNVDEDLIQSGYNWLLSQVKRHGNNYLVEDADPRYREEEEEHVMAEVLTSSYSCSYHMTPQASDHRNSVRRWYNSKQRRSSRLRSYSKLVLAKVTNTLVLTRARSRQWNTAVQILKRAHTDSHGFIYWSDEELEEPTAPMCYTTKPPSESIEATAYALLVFVEVGKKYRCNTRRPNRRMCNRYYVDTEKIADWLVLWRNGNGLFVEAMDTAIATEALAKYRESKGIETTSLNVDVATSPNVTFTQSMTFEEADAFTPQSIYNIPLGQELEVVTGGSGLGHMHVDSTYNTPIDVNANCRFDVTVTRYSQNSESLAAGQTGLCSVCQPSLTCPKGDNFKCERDSISSVGPASNTYCLNVCLRYHGDYNHGKLFIKVRMLSGYVPNECDLQELQGGRVVKATYNDEEEFVHIHLKTVSREEEECVGFRINKVRDVFRIKPAVVSVRSFNVEEWTCPRPYSGGDDSVSRPFYCGSHVNSQQRECSCINDACAQCSPTQSDELFRLQQKAGSSNYVFKLHAERTEDIPTSGIRHLIFTVEEELKSCLGTSLVERHVTFITKIECGCPHFQPGRTFWVMGADYRTYTDRNGDKEFRFFLNNETFLLSSERATNFDRDTVRIRIAVNGRRQCPT